MKYLKLFLLIVLCLLFLVSCTNILYGQNDLKYTSKYFFENYEPDYNLVYLEYSDRIGQRNYNPYSLIIRYNVIPQTDYEYFVVATSYMGMGSGHCNLVLKNKKYELQPLKAFKIKKIELYWKKYANITTLPTHLLKNYGDKIFNESAIDINDDILKRDIVKYIIENERKEDNSDRVHNTNETPYLEYSNILDENEYELTLRIYFEEHENLVWDSKILLGQDGNYYFAIKYNPYLYKGKDVAYDTRSLWHTCVQVPEDLQVLIEQLN